MYIHCPGDLTCVYRYRAHLIRVVSENKVKNKADFVLYDMKTQIILGVKDGHFSYRL